MAASEGGLNKDHVYETLFKDHFTTAARDSRRLAVRGKISSVNALAPSTSHSSTAVNAHAPATSAHALAPSTTVRDTPGTVDQQTLPEWGGGQGGGAARWTLAVPRDSEAEKEEKEDETEEKEDETEVVYGGSTENLCWQCRMLLEL